MREHIYELLDRVDGDIDLAVEEVLDGHKKTIRYVIAIGLHTIKSKRRSLRRRELRRVIQPKFRQGKTLGSVELTPKAKQRLFANTQELFGKDGWQIGNLMLADFTRDQLLAEADAEARSAMGHMNNAQFYRALAEPMGSGQVVRDVWTPDEVLALKKKFTEERNPTPV